MERRLCFFLLRRSSIRSISSCGSSMSSGSRRLHPIAVAVTTCKAQLFSLPATPPFSNTAALNAAQSGRFLTAAGPAVPWCMRALHRSLPTCTAVGPVGAGLQGTAPPPLDPQSLAPAQDRFDAAPGLQQPPRVAAQSRHGSAHNSIQTEKWSPARARCQGCSSWPAAVQDHKCAAIFLNCGFGGSCQTCSSGLAQLQRTDE